MIYETPDDDAPLTQGDIIEECPLVFWTPIGGALIRQSASSVERVMVLTQACDLANTKTSNVQVAIVHAIDWLVTEGILTAQTIRHCANDSEDQIDKNVESGFWSTLKTRLREFMRTKKSFLAACLCRVGPNR